VKYESTRIDLRDIFNETDLEKNEKAKRKIRRRKNVIIDLLISMR